MVEDKHIDVNIQNKVMHIGINRPSKKNALTKGMYGAIRMALENAGKTPDVMTVLIHGTRDAFSAGNDLKGFDNRDPNVPSPGVQFLYEIENFKKPIVAAVSGLAIGVGVTMLLHCDLVYAEPDTRFRMPFVNLGVCPEAGSTFMLPKVAGHRRAAEAMMLGDFFTTKKAIELGIVNEAASNVITHAAKKAEQMAQKPQQALLLTKQLLKQTTHQLVVDRIGEEGRFFGELLMTRESIDARAKIKERSKNNAHAGLKKQ